MLSVAEAFPRPHYCARPMHFGSRGPSEFLASVSDTSPKCIDGESLGRRRTRTRQMVTQYDSDLFFFRWNRHIFNVQKLLSLSCLIQLVWKKNYYRKRTSSWISRKIWNWRYYGLRGRNNQNLFHLGNFFCDTLIKMRQIWVFPIHRTESWPI